MLLFSCISQLEAILRGSVKQQSQSKDTNTDEQIHSLLQTEVKTRPLDFKTCQPYGNFEVLLTCMDVQKGECLEENKRDWRSCKCGHQSELHTKAMVVVTGSIFVCIMCPGWIR